MKNDDMLNLRSLSIKGIQQERISISYRYKKNNLKDALSNLKDISESRVLEGVNCLILSDRDIDQDRLAIPSLLAVSAIHHHLFSQGIRSRCSLILESRETREVHHFFLLLGFGTSAINPYLALDTIQSRSVVDDFSQKILFHQM